MKLLDTQLPALYSESLLQKAWNVPPEYVDRVYNILFCATADLLSSIKSKEKPAAFVINNVGGAFVAAGIVQYFEGEDGNPGNWSLAWTFNEEDIPENATIAYLSNSQTHPYFIATAGSKYSIQFEDAAAITTTMSECMIQLKKWLDENAREGEETTIEADGIFEAKSIVENGVKVFSVTPDGLIKQLIKSDDQIEK